MSVFEKANPIARIVAPLALVVALVGCTNPFLADNQLLGGTGGIRISGVQSAASGGSTSIRATVFPVVELSYAGSYDVVIKDGPGGGGDQTREGVGVTEDGFFEDNVEFVDLVPGEWTVEVIGYDAGGREFVRGETPVTVVRGEVATSDVPVRPNSGDGNGDLALDLVWPAQDDGEYRTTDVVTGYTYTIAGVDGQSGRDSDGIQPYSEEAQGGEYTLSIDEEDLEAGAYLVTVELVSENASPYGTVARYDELWYVYGNLTTAHTVHLDESDFSFGGGAGIGVTLETEEDLNRFFSGLDESGQEVASGAPFTISVALEDSEGNDITDSATLSWRINGKAVAADQGELDLVEFSGGEDRTIGRLTGIATEVEGSSGLTFTPAHGVDEDGVVQTEIDFPAGVSILVTLQVEHDGVHYSDSFTVEVVANGE